MRSESPSVPEEEDDVDGPTCAIPGDLVQADTTRTPEYPVSADHRQSCLANASLAHAVTHAHTDTHTHKHTHTHQQTHTHTQWSHKHMLPLCHPQTLSRTHIRSHIIIHFFAVRGSDFQRPCTPVPREERKWTKCTACTTNCFFSYSDNSGQDVYKTDQDLRQITVQSVLLCQAIEPVKAGNCSFGRVERRMECFQVGVLQLTEISRQTHHTVTNTRIIIRLMTS